MDLATQVVEARSYVERKNFQKAIEVLQQVLQQSPENVEARSLLNETSQKQRKWTIETWFLEAQTLRSQGNLKEARRTLEKILQFDSEIRRP